MISSKQVLCGAKDPMGIEVTAGVTPGDEAPPNYLLATEARLEVRRPNGHTTNWIPELSAATQTSIVLLYVFAADGTDVPREEELLVTAWVTFSDLAAERPEKAFILVVKRKAE
jgi:hypothetical protein